MSTTQDTLKSAIKLLSLGAVLLCLSSAAGAAKLIKPPIQDLFKDQSQISVLELKALNKEEERGEFTRVEDLWGKSEDSLSIKIGKKWVDTLKPGQRYIVAHSKFRKHPLLRDEIQPNPNGSEVLHPYVLGDAIFDDSAALRELITNEQKEQKDPATMLDKTLDLMSHSEGNTRLLAVFQFQMSSDLYAQNLQEKHLEPIQAALNSNDYSAEEHEFLVRASQAFPDGKRPSWIVDYCRKTIAENKTPYDLQTFVPLLVKTCTSSLGKDGDDSDIPRLSGLLLGNSPGVTKGALRALEARAGDKTPQLIADVMKNNPGVHNEAQSVLSTYLYEYAQRNGGGKGY